MIKTQTLNSDQEKIETSKDKLFSLLEVTITCIKYRGIVKSILILYYYLHTRFILKENNNIYYFLKYRIEYSSPVSLRNMFFELFGLNVYYFKSSSEKPIIIDLGANIGDTVIYFKDLYPKSTIFAFEPHPLAFKHLQKNVALNNFKSIKLFNEAIGYKKGLLTLSDNQENVFNSASIIDDQNIHNSKNQVKFKVHVNKLSSYPVISNLKKVDLIKMDVEGSESEILDDIKDILMKTKKIILEYHILDKLTHNSLDNVFVKLINCGLKPSVIGLYRNLKNSSNQSVFLIVGDR